MIPTIDLAQPRLGSRVVFASDDFFADKARLIDPAEPVFIPGKYDDNGKWMDGWESRRRRDGGNDHCIIRLGRQGFVEALTIDTRHFTGNYAPAVQIEGCMSVDEVPDQADWRALSNIVALEGNSVQKVNAYPGPSLTHLKLSLYPDGGVARLRVHGRIDQDTLAPSDRLDLAAMENGALAIIANDEHFGGLANITAPGKGRDMGDGWETRRRREPGFDWGIIRLARPGVIAEALIDTGHFKGNYPDRVSLQAALRNDLPTAALAADAQFWPDLLPAQQLGPDQEHQFSAGLADLGPVSHIRISLHPDGGISRLRLWGAAAEAK